MYQERLSDMAEVKGLVMRFPDNTMTAFRREEAPKSKKWIEFDYRRTDNELRILIRTYQFTHDAVDSEAFDRMAQLELVPRSFKITDVGSYSATFNTALAKWVPTGFTVNEQAQISQEDSDLLLSLITPMISSNFTIANWSNGTHSKMYFDAHKISYGPPLQRESGAHGALQPVRSTLSW